MKKEFREMSWGKNLLLKYPYVRVTESFMAESGISHHILTANKNNLVSIHKQKHLCKGCEIHHQTPRNPEGISL